MGYQAVILPSADEDLVRITPSLRSAIVKRIKWLADNSDQIIHHPLVGMPADLAGLCKLRVGDYRVLYWKSDEKRTIHVFRARHRSEIYKRLK